MNPQTSPKFHFTAQDFSVVKKDFLIYGAPVLVVLIPILTAHLSPDYAFLAAPLGLLLKAIQLLVSENTYPQE